MSTSIARHCPLSVLLVDADADTIDALAGLVRADGHDVRTAAGSAEALGRLDDWRPDAAILDPMLPGLDGFRLAERLCRGPGRRPLLVALCGTTLVRHHQRAAALFDLQFVKPVDPCKLAGLLRDYAARLAAAR